MHSALTAKKRYVHVYIIHVVVRPCADFVCDLASDTRVSPVLAHSPIAVIIATLIFPPRNVLISTCLSVCRKMKGSL
jgi:hypothetical protein